MVPYTPYSVLELLFILHVCIYLYCDYIIPIQIEIMIMIAIPFPYYNFMIVLDSNSNSNSMMITHYVYCRS